MDGLGKFDTSFGDIDSSGAAVLENSLFRHRYVVYTSVIPKPQ